MKLIWIPAHRGIVGNELADSLAKRAIREGRDTQLGIPIQEFRNLWKDQQHQNLHCWATEEAETRGAFYFQNFFSISKFIWFKKFNINRRSITSINKLRSGHSSLRASLFRFNIVNSPHCLSCGVEESPGHVLWVCKDFVEQRKILQEALVSARGYLPHPVNFLLATLDGDIIFALCNFINAITKFI